MQERESVRQKKEASAPKPWSNDPIFQTVYFCNVNREDDKITKWIRNFYKYDWNPIDFELNIIFARLINWPETLGTVGWITPESYDYIEAGILELQKEGKKVFGDAYIVSTNGRPMPKASYLAKILLPAAQEGLGTALPALRGHSLARAHAALMRCSGLGSFLSAQVIADLKYTKGHPLESADDWGSWAAEGPGSLRGLDWLNFWQDNFVETLLELRRQLPAEQRLWVADLQNLQNSLCEFDKFMRVKNGTGRSKRRYAGV
jgi:hypothetical protein